MTKVIVAGTRTFNDYDNLKEILKAGYDIENLEIVSGGARGADKLGERFAHEHDLPLKIFPADWNRYGKPAGMIRNKQMAEYADVAVVFWDGRSKGTANMIKQMCTLGKNVKIFRYK